MNREHKLVPLLAAAAQAAAKQGKFLDMHEALFKHQDEFKEDSFDEAEVRLGKLGRDLNLDLLRFQGDLKSAATVRFVRDDDLLAMTAKVKGTPTFFFLKPKGPAVPLGTIAEMDAYLNDPKNWK